MKPDMRMRPFLRVMHRFGRLGVNPVAGEFTKGEFFCLGAIQGEMEEHPELGGVYVWKLARHMQVHPPAASRLLRELEERGFIERSIDPADRRNIKVRLTAEGQAAWARAEAGADEFIRRVLARMGRENMDRLVSLCDQLCDIIEEEQEAKERT